MSWQPLTLSPHTHTCTQPPPIVLVWQFASPPSQSHVKKNAFRDKSHKTPPTPTALHTSTTDITASSPCQLTSVIDSHATGMKQRREYCCLLIQKSVRNYLNASLINVCFLLHEIVMIERWMIQHLLYEIALCSQSAELMGGDKKRTLTLAPSPNWLTT